MHGLHLHRVLDAASVRCGSGAQGMFLWPHLMSALVWGWLFRGVCLFVMYALSLGER